MPDTPAIEGLTRALAATGDVVAGIKNDQWSNPTPCSEWDVRSLANHLVSGNRLFAELLRGDPPPTQDDLARRRTADQLGDDPVRAYREASDALVQAFSIPGALERIVQVPVGPVPGVVALHLRVIESLVHGWDLAQATDQPADLPNDLAEQELRFAQSMQAPNVPRTGHPFGPVQIVAANASAIDRLVAFLGRKPDPAVST